jgi:hypothetical protein
VKLLFTAKALAASEPINPSVSNVFWSIYVFGLLVFRFVLSRDLFYRDRGPFRNGLKEEDGVAHFTDPDAAVTSRVARVNPVVDPKGFPAEPHKVGHRTSVDRAIMGAVLIGDFVLAPGSRETPASGREFGCKGRLSIPVKVESLFFKTYNDVVRGESVRKRGGEET